MSFRVCGVEQFARDQQLNFLDIGDRARAAAIEYGRDLEHFSARDLGKVFGNAEHAAAFIQARQKNLSRYG